MYQAITKKILLIGLLLGGLFSIYSFSSADKGKITFTAYVSGCDENATLKLYEFDGISFSEVMTGKKVKDLTYTFKMEKTEPRFYYIGQTAADIRPFILGSEDEVMFTGTCEDFRSGKIKNSELNTQYENLKKEINMLKNESNKLSSQLQRMARGGTEEQQQSLLTQLKETDNEKRALLESSAKSHPYLGSVVELNTYLSYQNNSGDYVSELPYFVDNFFQFANWEKENYNHIPWVYESMKSFTSTISKIQITDDMHQQFMDKVLNKIPQGSRTRKLALGGIMAALQPLSHGNYMHYAKQFISEYEKTDPEATASVKSEIDRVQAFMVGGTPPNFTQKSPEDEAISLEDFRGKVVLVDFWASWCGPCRKENPNVVKMYNRYKDKGFEILGVSLDRTKDRWVKAITSDNLTWPQVSDLKGWKNEVAQSYGVTSIPQTVLLDQEGKIIARNLRGPTLEAKLQEIFDK